MIRKTHAFPAALLLVSALAPLTLAHDAGPVPVVTVTLRPDGTTTLAAAPGWDCVALPITAEGAEATVLCDAVDGFCVDPGASASGAGVGTVRVRSSCGPLAAECAALVVGTGECHAQAEGIAPGPFQCTYNPVGALTWWEIHCWVGYW